MKIKKYLTESFINLDTNSGYTLLFSILISSIILAIGVSVLGLARKELMLTLGAKESQVAIYAADDGLECAVYWDTVGAFATTSTLTTIKCHDNVASLTRGTSADGTGTTDFKVQFDSLRCAVVTVTKEYTTHLLFTGLYLQTTVDSKGYNICGNNPKKVERYLQMVY